MNQKSNSVPKETFKFPSSIIQRAKFYQFISNSLASKFVYKLFVTPLKFKTPERELMMRKSAKNISIEVPGIEHQIMLYEYGFSKTKVLLAHGWSGRGTQLYEIADKLLENGMMVIAFDTVAHGQSNGKTTNLQDNIKVTEYIAEQYGPFQYAIGHSFGAMTLLNAQASKSLFEKIISISQEGSLSNVIDEFAKKLELKQKVADGVKNHIKSIFNISKEAIDGNAIAKKINIPVLVLHDMKDTDVDVSSAFKLRQNLQQGTVVISNGLGHRKILRDQEVISRIIKFLKPK